MSENDNPVLIYSTFPDLETARNIGKGLIEARLAACVNILPGMTSVYRWQGTIEDGQEVVMIIKTRRSLAASVVDTVTDAHPYDVPAVVTVPVEGGFEPYLAWIMNETQPSAT